MSVFTTMVVPDADIILQTRTYQECLHARKHTMSHRPTAAIMMHALSDYADDPIPTRSASRKTDVLFFCGHGTHALGYRTRADCGSHSDESPGCLRPNTRHQKIPGLQPTLRAIPVASFRKLWDGDNGTLGSPSRNTLAYP